MDILKLAGIILIALSLSLILRKSGNGHPEIVAAVCAVFAVKLFSEKIFGASEVVTELLSESGADEYRTTLYKAIGITLITETVSGICTEMNENELSRQMLILGKTELLILALPLVKKLFELTKSFANG